MLNRLLIVLDVLLVVAAGALGLHLYQIWTAPAAAAAPAAPPAAAVAESPGAAPRPPAIAPAALAVIAERNLFSPTRTEVVPEPPKPTTVAGPPAAIRPAEKPRLYGVVIGTDGGARAYLWDPQSKKVFGYKVGDSVAESRIEQINADRVVLKRSTETFEVLLRDPSKPKPPPPPVAVAPPGAIPGQPGVPGVPGIPGVPGVPQVPGGVAPGVPAEGGVVPFAPNVGYPGAVPPTEAGVAPPSPTPVVPPRRPSLPGFIPGRPTIRPPGQPMPAQPPQSGGAGS